MTELQHSDRGSQSDYVLGSVLGWGAFDVVRWQSVEALSEPFRYRIVVQRNAERGPVAIDSLVNTGATLGLTTEARWRQVHGVVAEAELLEHTGRLLLYQVVLAPHLVRAAYRRHCRTFVDQTLRAIVDHALQGMSATQRGAGGLFELSQPPVPPPEQPDFQSFREPHGYYRWNLSEPERAAEPRKLVVQYNETDLAFVSRLLEAEGISYLFEHVGDGCIVTLTDRPGAAPLFARDESHELVGGVVGGTARDQEVVRVFRRRTRLRPTAVTMRDYAWRKSHTRLEAAQVAAGATAPLEHYEFPARDEDHPTAPGQAPAQFQLERYAAETRLSEGYGTVRTHEPGYRFRLRDRAAIRDDQELCVVRVEAHAVQLVPESTVLAFETIGMQQRGAVTEPFYESRFEAVPAEVRYRPERRTPKNRIIGIQSARVTAEEISREAPPPELNNDELGRVRVRFPWDQRENDGTPTSKWVRVAQHWAGPGFGALYVPRVGHEVLVAFEDGDPDRPVVVGRVYNAQNQPPYLKPNTSTSTLKSDSVGSDGSPAEGFNELRFEDAADQEQVFLHAQRNLDEVVRASHSTSVGGDQSNSVGGDQSNTVHGNRTHHVHGTEQVTVDSVRLTQLNASETHVVAAERSTAVGAEDKLSVGADHKVTVGASQSIGVSANRKLTVGGHQRVEQGGVHLNIAAEHTFKCNKLVIEAGSATLSMQSGAIVLDNGAGANVVMSGGLVYLKSGDLVSLSGSHSLDSSGNTTLQAATAAINSNGGTSLFSGGDIKLEASGNINSAAALIKQNG